MKIKTIIIIIIIIIIIFIIIIIIISIQFSVNSAETVVSFLDTIFE